MFAFSMHFEESFQCKTGRRDKKLVGIAVNLVSLRGRKVCLTFFEYARQSDPKKQKIVTADQECGDHGGHSTRTPNINAANAPVISFSF